MTGFKHGKNVSWINIFTVLLYARLGQMLRTVEMVQVTDVRNDLLK